VYQRLIPRLCEHCSLDYSGYSDQELVNQLGPIPESDIRFSGRYRVVSERFGIELDRLRFRNVLGCDYCRTQSHQDVWGFNGRTVVAEMIEPMVETEFLDLLKRNDSLRIHKWFKNRSRSAWDDPDMKGKSAFACAIYKMSTGLIDPRDIKSRFGLLTRPGLID
jgi:general secretion pathway protein E